MKKLYLLLFPLTFLFPKEKSNNSFTSDIQFFETEKKTVALLTTKTNFFTPKSKKYKFKKDRYFEIVPPEYKTRLDTMTIFDTSIDHKAMDILYAPATEQILLSEGGWKWIEEKTILKNCPDDIQILSKKKKVLKYIKEKSEYGRITKIVIRNTHGASRLLNENPEEYRRRVNIAKEIVEKGKRQKVFEITTCIKDGYLKEILFEDFIENKFPDLKLIKFKKGSWTLLKPQLLKDDCKNK